MQTIWSTLWLRKASMSAQMVNETNLRAEESWAVRTRKGSGWCGSAFSKFPAQLSCCFSSSFKLLLHIWQFHITCLRQMFLAIRVNSERFHGDLQCVFEALFLASLGALPLSFFRRRWSFMWTAWLAQRSCDCIKMV